MCSSISVEPIVELLQGGEEVVDEAVDHLVEEAAGPAGKSVGIALVARAGARRGSATSSRRTVTR